MCCAAALVIESLARESTISGGAGRLPGLQLEASCCTRLSRTRGMEAVAKLGPLANFGEGSPNGFGSGSMDGSSASINRTQKQGKIRLGIRICVCAAFICGSGVSSSPRRLRSSTNGVYPTTGPKSNRLTPSLTRLLVPAPLPSPRPNGLIPPQSVCVCLARSIESMRDCCCQAAAVSDRGVNALFVD